MQLALLLAVITNSVSSTYDGPHPLSLSAGSIAPNLDKQLTQIATLINQDRVPEANVIADGINKLISENSKQKKDDIQLISNFAEKLIQPNTNHDTLGVKRLNFVLMQTVCNAHSQLAPDINAQHLELFEHAICGFLEQSVSEFTVKIKNDPSFHQIFELLVQVTAGVNGWDNMLRRAAELRSLQPYLGDGPDSRYDPLIEECFINAIKLFLKEVNAFIPGEPTSFRQSLKSMFLWIAGELPTYDVITHCTELSKDDQTKHGNERFASLAETYYWNVLTQRHIFALSQMILHVPWTGIPWSGLIAECMDDPQMLEAPRCQNKAFCLASFRLCMRRGRISN